MTVFLELAGVSGPVGCRNLDIACARPGQLGVMERVPGPAEAFVSVLAVQWSR